MRKSPKARAEGKHRKMTHCEGESGKKEERKKQRLSSQNRNRSGRKKAEREGKSPKARAKGKHQWNSCGSETGKDERKQTESRVRRTGREDIGN